jgi:hypothetical protein
MAFFGGANQQQDVSPRFMLENKARYAGSNILILAIVTLICILIPTFGGDMYFPYCFYLPYFITVYCALLTGRFPPEFYQGLEGWEGTEFLPQSIFVVGLIISILMVAVIALVFVLSLKNKKKGVFIAAILYSIDTALMVLLAGIDLTMILDYALHAFGLFYLWSGYSAILKLEKMPPEEPVAVAPAASDFYTGDNVPEDFPVEEPREEETPVETPVETPTEETPSDEFRL